MGAASASTDAAKRTNRRRGDLRPRALPSLSWAQADAAPALETLYRELEGRYIEAADWYIRDKRLSSRWARLLRLLSILLTAGGSLVPLLQGTGLAHPNINWGYIQFALAAACVAVDRFFGLSSAWMRDMVAAITVQQRLSQLQMAWANWNLVEHSSRMEATSDGFIILSGYADALSEIILGETGGWASEFHTRLSEADSATHTPTRSPQLSAMSKARQTSPAQQDGKATVSGARLNEPPPAQEETPSDPSANL